MASCRPGSSTNYGVDFWPSKLLAARCAFLARTDDQFGSCRTLNAEIWGRAGCVCNDRGRGLRERGAGLWRAGETEARLSSKRVDMSTEPDNLVIQLLHDMRSEIGDMRAEMATKADLKSESDSLRSEMGSLRADVGRI